MSSTVYNTKLFTNKTGKLLTYIRHTSSRKTVKTVTLRNGVHLFP